MNFWDMITGNDMKNEFKLFDMRVKKLPTDYQAAWEEMNSYLWPNSDFTGRKLMPIFEGVLGLLEECAQEGQPIQAVLGDDLQAFCSELANEQGPQPLREKWREQLNRSITQKLSKLENNLLQELIAGKKKWRALMARVKALPQEYQIVYSEIQKYTFKASPFEFSDGTDVLSGIIELFEEGAALGKNVLEITGNDVAAFCDALIP